MTRGLALVFLALTALAVPAAAQAQATRTWVSGTGDDINPCNRVAPCKTFAGAISKTAAGGEIDVLDDGGFGSVTITKSLTIDGGGHLAGVLHSGSTGVTVNAGPTDRVVLRGLSISGSGGAGSPECPGVTGPIGVHLRNGGSLRIEDTQIDNNTTAGLQLTPEASNPNVLLDRVAVGEGCQDGINASPAAGRTLNLMVKTARSRTPPPRSVPVRALTSG